MRTVHTLEGEMPTLVQFPRERQSATHAAELIADYTAFDRARAERRPWINLSIGFAAAILAGSAFGRLPGREGLIGAAVFGSPAIPLLAVETLGWRRLQERLERLRSERCRIRKL
jgi:hypothetical protein